MDGEVEPIERATLAAVPPQALEEAHGWLLAFDDGTVGRAHSAAPLRHDAATAATASAVLARYREQGRRPVLRLPDAEAFAPLQAQLARDGFAAGRPTLVQVAPLATVAPRGSGAAVELAGQASDPWRAVFLGEGFDPADGASRSAILARSRDTVYASIAQGGRCVAVGAGCLAHGWCGIHGMRTLPEERGRGHAGAILAALAQAAAARGITRAFLQVEEGNAGARSLYRAAGFRTAWRYRYWA